MPYFRAGHFGVSYIGHLGTTFVDHNGGAMGIRVKKSTFRAGDERGLFLTQKRQ